MNKVTIYYFSGTGNSLAIARDIAAGLNGEVLAADRVIDQEVITPEADVIGIVFPVYNQGVPLIINRLISKIAHLEQKYVFAVCTCGGSPGISLEYLARAITANNGRLAAGFSVNMPYNYLFPPLRIINFFKYFRLRVPAPEKQQEMLIAWRAKLPKIIEVVRSKKEVKYETDSEFIEHLVDFLNLRETLQKAAWLKVAGYQGKTLLPFRESIQVMDYGFHFDDTCSSCGTCAKLCPVGNIKMIDGRPVWQHHCEQCFACLHWCPREAIQFNLGTAKGTRYHHPAVKLAEMLKNNRPD